MSRKIKNLPTTIHIVKPPDFKLGDTIAFTAYWVKTCGGGLKEYSDLRGTFVAHHPRTPEWCIVRWNGASADDTVARANITLVGSAAFGDNAIQQKF